ncbi:5-aminolevulinate synthase [Streptomyces graminofaciens]|uniref:8-amino-7-oxononanoate synthase n=1 Tax=Streptomyces graminofaciens TaxID=68212 RepID=A0ABN5VSH7_9ACTN|nr:5-aminolevulinate synthase [Streptomyces graminofaciens]BBC36454.1 5-aminolevulinate synthase [Streptomyces graminofaciens]
MAQYMPAFSQHMKELEAAGGKREFLEIGRLAGRFPAASSTLDGTSAEISVWCSNDYLGMGQHPSVLTAIKEIIDEYGAGAGGSRNIGGTNHYHVLLEKELADLHGKEDALLFTSGYTANDGALSVLAGRLKDCVVFSDELNHASIIDGLRHSRAEKHIFRHNDCAHLEELIAAVDPDRPKMIVMESVYSMAGDIAPLAEIVDIAKRYEAMTFLDEVHAVGMYGPQGAGIAASLGMADEFTVIMGTLAKGFGTTGGYIAGPSVLIDAVRGLSRSFIFTTALPPAFVAGSLAAVRHLRNSDTERDKLRDNAQSMHRLLKEHGIPFISDRSHIVSVLVGDDTTCKKASDILLERHGIYVQSINAPSVRVGEEILRIAPGAVHSAEEVRKFVEALDGIWTELELPRAQNPEQASAARV